MKKNLCISSFLLFFLFLTTTSDALSQLPRNAFLQYNDNSRDVKTLQEILNSDPDTIITNEGAGSPGKENWFFGELTRQAVSRFQSIHNITVSGKVDLSTLKVLNQVASGQLKNNSSTSKTYGEIEVPKEEENIYLNSEKNPHISVDNPQENTTTNPTEKISKTYLDSMLEKYTNYFSNNSEVNQRNNNPNVPNNPNNPLTNVPPNPYLNPFANPYLSPYANPYGKQNPTGNSGGGGRGFGGGGSGGGQQSIFQRLSSVLGGGQQGSQQNSPTPMYSANYSGQTGGPLNKNLKEAGDGWLSGPTTHFGTEWSGARDATPGSNCNAAMSSSINICSAATCIVALPIAAQVYFWGTAEQKEKMRSLIGRSAGAQVKALRWSYGKIKGSPIEIVNTTNGKCTVAPIWETGPGDSEGGGIDLTPCIKKAIGNSNNFVSKFRPVKAGATGCEGYNIVESLVEQIK